mgnify:FL=1
MLKAVIFDLDGTVGNTLPLCIAAFRKAVEPLAGKKLSDAEIAATFGPSEEGTIRALIPQHYDEGVAVFLKAYEALHGLCPRPFDGMAELLRRLKEKGIVVALVTGKGAASCRITLERFGLTDCFDAVETGSPAGPRKEAGIRAVLQRFGLEPAEALYVGDAPGDATASRKTGVPMVAAAWAPTADVPALRAAAPDELFTSVEALSDWLEGRIKNRPETGGR